MNISPDVLDVEASREAAVLAGTYRSRACVPRTRWVCGRSRGSVSQVGARVGSAEERGEDRRYAEAGAWRSL